jgi:alkylation response protein AidB-like acyl-CoA dehydrogenase
MTNTFDSSTGANGANSAAHAQGNDFPKSDPAVYNEYKTKWSQTELPSNEEGWIARAKEVSSILAVDIVKRNKENKAPFAEVALLKHAGLLKVLGPKKYGGGEQPWSVGYKLIRAVANGDR